MAQTVSRLFPNAEDRVRSLASPCETRAEQIGTGTGSSPVPRFNPAAAIPPMFDSHSFTSGVRGGVVGWGTERQAGKSRFRFDLNCSLT